MKDLKTILEVEAEDFTDELSDEALDREERRESFGCNYMTAWLTRKPAQ